MRFSCKTKDILHKIGIVSRAIGSQQTLPILHNILFHVEGKRCTLSATNLEFSIISSLDAEVENEGSITIPAKAIQNFAQYSTGEEVVFESSEDSQLKCQSKKSKTVIAGEPSSEYPTISPIKKEVQITISDSDLFQALHHVSFASARTTTRPVLSGVYCKILKNEMILAATDSYRLSEYKVPVIKAEGEVDCIVPSKVFVEIMSILGGEKRRGSDDAGTGSAEDDEKEKKTKGEPITITLSPQQIEVVIGSTKVLSRLIDGSFPDYQQIIPTSSKTKLSLPHQELLTTVKRMHYFAKESNNNLTFSTDKEEVQIQTQLTQIGRDEAQIEAGVQGEKNKIALSSSYLLDFLSHVSGEEVQMELTDKMHPAVFHMPDQPEFLHLIMPLRIAEEK